MSSDAQLSALNVWLYSCIAETLFRSVHFFCTNNSQIFLMQCHFIALQTCKMLKLKVEQKEKQCWLIESHMLKIDGLIILTSWETFGIPIMRCCRHVTSDCPVTQMPTGFVWTKAVTVRTRDMFERFSLLGCFYSILTVIEHFNGNMGILPLVPMVLNSAVKILFGEKLLLRHFSEQQKLALSEIDCFCMYHL